MAYRSLLFHGLCSTKSRRGRNQQKCEIPKEPGGTGLMKSFVSPSLVLEPCLFLPRDFQIGRRHRQPPRIGNSRLVRKKFGDKAYRVRRTRILPNGSAFTVETGILRTNKDINTTCSVDRALMYAAEISFSAGGSTAHACSRTRRTPAIIRLDKRTSTDHTDLSPVLTTSFAILHRESAAKDPRSRFMFMNDSRIHRWSFFSRNNTISRER